MKQLPTILSNIDKSIHEDAFPVQIFTKTQTRFYIIIDPPKEAKIYTYLTWRFPHQLSRGKKYIFVVYDYNSNAVLFKAMPKQKTNTIIKIWSNARYDFFKMVLQPLIIFWIIRARWLFLML